MSESNVEEEFWEHLQRLFEGTTLVIDRPKGMPHPRYPEIIYPVDYGYLRGTSSADGKGIDVWVGSLADKEIVGAICTVDLLKRDVELKVLYGCTEDEIDAALHHHNEKTMRSMLMRRAGD